MSQIISRNTHSLITLGTLADGVSMNIDSRYGSALTERAVLLGYKYEGILIADPLEAGNGFVVCLVDQDITDAELNSLLGTRIDKGPAGAVELATQMKLKGICKAIPGALSSAQTISRLSLDITFGKGVPYEETNGWCLLAFNNSGAALTTGGFIGCVSIEQRFAYVR